MKKTSTLVRTLKLEVFKVFSVNGQDDPAIKEIDGHLVINANYCDLRPVHKRINSDTNEFIPSCIENILTSQSILSYHYAHEIDGMDTLYDFLALDYSGGSDYDPVVAHMKDISCYDGLYVPLDKLEAIGYIPHDEAEYMIFDGVKHIKYRLTLQSASENRLCKATFSTYRWDTVARTVSANAEYLYKATHVPQKAIARLGLAKSNGTIVEDFDFSFVLVDDLMTDITFNARCYNDAENKINDDIINLRKTATDGHGWITPAKAKELADQLGFNYVPSAFQVRYGQVKGLLLVFDFFEYCTGKVPYDIIFTRSMWKANFDTSTITPRVCTNKNEVFINNNR